MEALFKRDFEGEGKKPYLMNRDPGEEAIQEIGQTEALKDLERRAPWPWSHEVGGFIDKIRVFIGGECGKLFVNTIHNHVEQKKQEQETDQDLASDVSRKREASEVKIIMCALAEAAADAHECLLGQQYAFVGDGKETVNDVATTDTPDSDNQTDAVAPDAGDTTTPSGREREIAGLLERELLTDLLISMLSKTSKDGYIRRKYE